MRRAVVCFLLVLATPAHAASVRVTQFEDDPREDLLASRLSYTAAPGEHNRVKFRSRGQSVVITDRGARLRAGRRCRSLTRHRVRCRFDRGSDRFAFADLGDRADRFVLLGLAGFSTRVLGGAGDDRLSGSPAADHLAGQAGDDRLVGRGGPDLLDDGPGRDVVRGGTGGDRMRSTDRGRAVSDHLDGGAGRDVVSYASRSSRVIGRLPNRAGTRGERDRLHSVEGLRGGSGPDDLRGTDAADRLDGGTGSDRIAGGGGNDRLTASNGRRVRISGGPGDDAITVHAYKAPNDTVVRCGSGRDRVDPNTRPPLLRADCERVGAYPVEPVRVTPDAVVLRLPCGYEDSPGRRVRLLSPDRVVLAEGLRRAYDDFTFKTCRVRLTVTPAGAALPRPVVVAVRYPDHPRWRFVLRD